MLTASGPPFTVNKICPHNNEHFEEISRRGAETCSPRKAKGDGTPTNESSFIQQCDICRIVQRNHDREWTWVFKTGGKMIFQVYSFLLKTNTAVWGCTWPWTYGGWNAFRILWAFPSQNDVWRSTWGCPPSMFDEFWGWELFVTTLYNNFVMVV